MILLAIPESMPILTHVLIHVLIVGFFMKARKYEIAGKLEYMIKTGQLKPAEKLPSQNELCEKYSVSRSCIHGVLNLLFEKGFIEKTPGIGIFVRGFNVEVSEIKSIGFILPEYKRLIRDTEDNFGFEMIWGIEEALRSEDINLVIRRINLGSDLSNLISIVEKMNVSGVILDRDIPDTALQDLKALGIPFVTCVSSNS